MNTYNRQAQQREAYERQCICDEHQLLANPDFAQFAEEIYLENDQEMKRQLKKKVKSSLLKRKRTRPSSASVKDDKNNEAP